SEERVAAPDVEPRGAEAAQLVDRRRTAGVAGTAAGRLVGVPAAGPAGDDDDARQPDWQAGHRGRAGSTGTSAGPAADNAAGRGADYGTGFRGDDRRCQPIPTGIRRRDGTVYIVRR